MEDKDKSNNELTPKEAENLDKIINKLLAVRK
jgi:hypothetical protein